MSFPSLFSQVRRRPFPLIGLCHVLLPPGNRCFLKREILSVAERAPELIANFLKIRPKKAAICLA